MSLTPYIRSVSLIITVLLIGCRPATLPEAVGQPPARSDAFDGAEAGAPHEVAGIKLCWCPAGRFRMGSPPGERDRHSDEQQVDVRLTRGFWMGKYAVTQGDWKRVAGKLPGPLTAGGGEGNDFPVYNLNYAEA